MADRNIWTPATPVVGSGKYQNIVVIGGIYPLLTTDLALNRTVSLFKVGRGFNLIGISGYVDALDTNGAPTLTLSLGDAGSATRLLNAVTTGRAGGALTSAALPAAAFGYNYSADTELILTASAAAATAQAGNLRLFLHGWFDA